MTDLEQSMQQCTTGGTGMCNSEISFVHFDVYAQRPLGFRCADSIRMMEYTYWTQQLQYAQTC